MTNIKPQPGIMNITPYVGGAAHVPGQSNSVKLSSNENPHGPSPRAIDAFVEAGKHLHVYPSGNHQVLKDAIAGIYGLSADNIICGAGSDEIIAFLCQTYAGPGDTVIHAEHGFEMYKISARVNGAEPISVPERDRQTDVDAMLAACDERSKLMFIAAPNNPTGTMISAGEIARLADALPDHMLLVLDGAYAEYIEGYDGGAALVEARENVVMTRTFSKIYGLGSLRVGWGYAPDHVIDTLNRVRGPFNVSAAGLAAATAAVLDQDYVDHCRTDNAKSRAWLAGALRDIGIPSDQSFGNFILARFDSETAAQGADDALRDAGLLVRRVANYGLPNALRITVGDETACHRVVATLTEFMGTVA